MELHRKRLRRMFYAVEINLILWMAAFATSFMGASTAWADWTPSQQFMLIGFVFAAIAQHWAYYSLYRGDGASSN